MMKLEIGKKYKLPHGVGVLLGTEVFDRQGKTLPLFREIPSHYTDSTRFIFQIDPESEWANIMKSTKYAAWGRQIQNT